MQAAVEGGLQPRREAGRFLVTFAILAGMFYAAALWPPFDRVFYVYLEANARIVNALLRLMAQGTQVHGLTVLSPEFGISIRRGCDGLEPAWIFCSAVLAFPAPALRKAAILPLGVGLILAANLVRILSLYFIGARMPGFFPVAHLEIWPAAFMVLVIALWLWWVRAPARPVAAQT
jgi:exosortase/archaeosortase family protein